MTTDLFDLTDRVAIVTGASSGLGVVFAEALAEAGANLSICARRLRRLEETAEKLRPLGRRCLAVQADVARPDQVNKLVERTMREYGRIDILVNNAGIAGPGPDLSEEADIEAYQQVMNINLTSAVLCTNRVGREMLTRGYGRIINISSVLGVIGGVPVDRSMNAAAYTISKHGMVGLNRVYALQWARQGITVNAIAPAYFPSEMTQLEGEVLRSVERRTPVGRMGRPGELKTTLLFLAAEASSYVTGQVICVDGGWTAW